MDNGSLYTLLRSGQVITDEQRDEIIRSIALGESKNARNVSVCYFNMFHSRTESSPRRRNCSQRFRLEACFCLIEPVERERDMRFDNKCAKVGV